jgi:uncharacterized membrane protein YjgN (DUF898 family)
MTTFDATAARELLMAPVAPVPTGPVRFLGRERDYWRLLIRGSLLLLVTLGIYRFWLATDQRRFLWANTEIAGNTLEYTGTARELLIGFLIALTVLVPLNVAFFFMALYLGVFGQFASVFVFLILSVLGQYAVFRARRYRLSRTIYRGVRCYQTGSAWRYAFMAFAWWIAVGFTLGLAYPWAQASLERYKMRHTFYGNLQGRFSASGTRLFLRGIWMWLLLVGPLVAGIAYGAVSIDWVQLAEAVARGGDNIVGQVDGAAPEFAKAAAIMIFAMSWTITAAAVMYPAFQAMMLRWWSSGVVIGDLAVHSHLRTGQTYGIYLKFLGLSILFGIAVMAIAAVAAVAIWALALPEASEAVSKDTIGIVTGVVTVVLYLVFMLGYSVIYQVVVKQRLWRAVFESLDLTGLSALDNVKQEGAPASPVGEGFADALGMGSL